MNIRGVIFDKDGTLFDFQSTWGIWTAQILVRIAGSDGALLGQLARALGYDTEARRVQPGSVIVAGTPMEIAAVIHGYMPAMSQTQIFDWLNKEAETAPQVLVTDLHRLTGELRCIDLGLCVMTNDAEIPARAHLASVQALDLFDFVIGSDSGFAQNHRPRRCWLWPIKWISQLRLASWWVTVPMIYVPAVRLECAQWPC